MRSHVHSHLTLMEIHFRSCKMWWLFCNYMYVYFYRFNALQLYVSSMLELIYRDSLIAHPTLPIIIWHCQVNKATHAKFNIWTESMYMYCSKNPRFHNNGVIDWQRSWVWSDARLNLSFPISRANLWLVETRIRLHSGLSVQGTLHKKKKSSPQMPWASIN